MAISLIDLETFKSTPITTAPFNYVVTPRFVRTAALPLINADYPDISTSGSFPLGQLNCGPVFQQFVDELESTEFRTAFEEKFKIDLAARPTTVTVRGWCASKDGKIHTDPVNKIITVLIYLNSSWEVPGKRLGLLRSADDLDDLIARVPPIEGTMLAFKRGQNSWHGHKPFAGARRVIQFNWLTSEKDQRIAMLRHHASAAMKRVAAVLSQVRPAPVRESPSVPPS
jgi:hypothetical protein